MAWRLEGFEERGGEVVVFHHGHRATVLRGAREHEFVDDVERGDPQELMARVTGNCRRGSDGPGTTGATAPADPWGWSAQCDRQEDHAVLDRRDPVA